MYRKAVCSLLHCQSVSVTSYLLQTGCESPEVISAVKTDIRHKFAYLKATSFSSRLQTKPAVIIIMPFSSVNVVLFQSYNLQICQSYPQH